MDLVALRRHAQPGTSVNPITLSLLTIPGVINLPQASHGFGIFNKYCILLLICSIKVFFNSNVITIFIFSWLSQIMQALSNDPLAQRESALMQKLCDGTQNHIQQ
ncbi:hypothetical protein AVEN_87798-1 [Araneus ventricosus]|uniref:Uncharacterized protein n=1 Tax=Araneus ventricosus TaxID=182803 RepID=A0A4Y2BD82_ARAVE|nr:hypothetical protein AVEN_87798-1 [Araneus ventricosus]